MGDNSQEATGGQDQSGPEPSSSESSSETGGESGSKAGWVLLGGAALLAVASIGYNLYSSSEEDAPVVASADGLPTIEELREAAESSSDDAGPWSELGFAHFERGEFAQAV